MKRDMDLIRKILFFFEKKRDFHAINSKDIDILEYDSQLIAYHIDLMCEAGFLSCERITSTSTPDRLITALPFRLTWQGHEFLDAAREPGRWQKAKSILNTAGGASFQILLSVLTNTSDNFV